MWYLETYPLVESYPIPIDVDLIPVAVLPDLMLLSDNELPTLRTPLPEDGKVNIVYELTLEGTAKAFHLDAKGEDSAETEVETSMTIVRADAEVLACSCITMDGEFDVKVVPTEDMIGKSADIQLTLQNEVGSVTVDFSIYIQEKEEEGDEETEAESVPFVVLNETLTDEVAETNSTASNSTAEVDAL